jgi:hypothetical protein
MRFQRIYTLDREAAVMTELAGPDQFRCLRPY